MIRKRTVTVFPANNQFLLDGTSARETQGLALSTFQWWRKRAGRGAGRAAALPAYDELNRRRFTTFHDGKTIENIWDAGNRTQQILDSASAAASIYRWFDGLDRLTLEVRYFGTVGYTYDDASRLQTMTVSGQPSVVYTWDDANRLTDITRGTLSVGLDYDAADRRTTLTLPNGITVDYGYDNANQLESLTYKQGSTTLGDLTYAYDGGGRRIGMGGSYARANLPPALPLALYDANNRLAWWGGLTLSYDDNGNLQSDGFSTYTWNARNQLTGIGGLVSAGFAYDAIGRRTVRSVGSSTLTYVYDGWNVAQRRDASGTPLAHLISSRNLDEHFGEITSAGTMSYFTDALGSTVALSNSSGATTAEFTYEPYGKATRTGSADTPFRYTGRDDDGTGLYYYRARYYHPRFGRFVAEDPIGLLGGTNLYAHVRGDPVSLTDPTGEYVWLVAAAAGAAWVAYAYADFKGEWAATQDAWNYYYQFDEYAKRNPAARPHAEEYYRRAITGAARTGYQGSKAAGAAQAFRGAPRDVDAASDVPWGVIIRKIIDYCKP